jgi:hypothetical protein
MIAASRAILMFQNLHFGSLDLLPNIIYISRFLILSIFFLPLATIVPAGTPTF